MLVGLFALGLLPLASLATQAPASAATLTFAKVEKIGVPRSVVFRTLPPPTPQPHDSLPFHPRSASAFAAAKQAAETGGPGRSAGVVAVSPALASPSSRAPMTPLTTAGGGGSLQIVNAFPLTDRNAQIGWFPPGSSQAVAPPDTQIAVGDTQLMEMVNDSGSIWDKATGAHSSHVSLYSFFGDLSRPTSAGVTDPRVFYDGAIQRWFASVLGFTNAGESWVYLARSDTPDPGGAWHVYTISHRTTTLQDQPKLGVTSDKVVMSWNDFIGINFVGSETVVIQKSDLGTLSLPTIRWMTNGADPSRFNLIPVQGPTLTPTSYLAYNIYDNSPNPKSLGRLGLISIAGTPVGNNLTALEQDLSITPTSMPPGAEQSPGSPRLATNDDSFTSAAFSNGILWVAGNDGCLPAESTLRSCLRVIQLSLVGTPAVIQDVDLGQNGGHLFFPAVELDASGNMTAVYTASSVSTPASVATTGQAAATIGTWERGWVVATGVGPYDCGTCSTGFNGVRWGDYSAAVVDPTSGDVWVAGEYAPSLTDKADWGTGAAHMAITPSVLKTAMSTAQYQLTSSDGSTWVPIDPSHLSLTITPATAGTAIFDANVDLWTANAGINQDIGIFVKAGAGPDALVAWKESGGFAGTFSPNAAFVHHVMSVTANVQYTVSLRWKANRPATGASIFAGAGPIGGTFSPTRLTARLVESGSTALSKVSTNQYIRSSGTNWTDIDGTILALDVPATPNAMAVISANADLWTVKPGFNQDLGIAVGGNVVAWKESGGFAGTFSPNAAFVQTIVDASSAFHVSLKWKTNTSAAGGEIRAGAGQSPFSPSRLTVELVPTSTVRTAVSTPDKQYQLTGSDGTSWAQPDPVLLHLSVTPTSTNCLAVVSVNIDLWTANAGVNQDIAIAVSYGSNVNVPVTHSPAVIAWKESGGNAGTFSPNAAFLQTVIQFSGSMGPYDLTVQWKSNIRTGGQIRGGAGLSPNFSPTRLTAQLICS
jgi:hypothetical protein